MTTEVALGLVCATCEQIADSQHRSHRQMVATTNPLIKHENRMVLASTTAKAMEQMAGSSEQAAEAMEVASQAGCCCLAGRRRVAVTGRRCCRPGADGTGHHRQS